MSKGEDKIEELLKKGSIKFQKEVSFKGLVGKKHHNLRFDFAIFNNKGQLVSLIEVDGRQHYEFVKYFHKTITNFKKQLERDRIKNKFCLINNIPLIRIPYWDLDNLTLQKLLTNQSYRVKSKYHQDYLIQKLKQQEGRK